MIGIVLLVALVLVVLFKLRRGRRQVPKGPEAGALTIVQAPDSRLPNERRRRWRGSGGAM